MKNLKFVGLLILFIGMMVLPQLAEAHPHHRHARHAIQRHRAAVRHHQFQKHHRDCRTRSHGHGRSRCCNRSSHR
ncbi:MAG: hypothetical protein KA198_03070 [Chitinophagaceae bacterium]|nr:hypothetical protein [Chitinophagaceae bacterium]